MANDSAQQKKNHERRRESRVPTNDSGSIQLLGTNEHFDIRVLDVSRSGLKIHTPTFLGIGAIVRVTLRHTAILGEVRYCVRTDDGFRAGLFIQDCVERRRSTRFPVHILGTIRELQTEQPARIVDQSAEGMLITVQRRVSEGATILISAQGALILANVVYCKQEGGAFKIGVKIEKGRS